MFQEAPRALGLDIGSKTIGVAVSDRLGWTARPVCTVRRSSWAEDLAKLTRLCAEHEVAQLVVGLPLSADGGMTEQARFNQRAAEKLHKALALPVAYVDESLTSVDADAYMAAVGMNRRRRKERIDQQAAALILQDYLDEQRRLTQAPQTQHLQQEKQD